MMFAREAHVLVSKYFLCILQIFWVPRFFFGEEDLEDWWGDGVELLVIFLMPTRKLLSSLGPRIGQFQFKANV